MRILVAAAVLLILGSCAAPAPRRLPPAPAAVVPLPTGPVLTLPAADWRDWPLTPGDWRYNRDRLGYTSAVYVVRPEFLVVLTCGPGRRTVSLSVPGDMPSPLTVRTSSTTRTLATVVRSGRGIVPPSMVQADLAAADPLLDAIGFSRGRFVVEQAGRPTLVLPAWAEIERVTEDCRG